MNYDNLSFLPRNSPTPSGRLGCSSPSSIGTLYPCVKAHLKVLFLDKIKIN